MADFTLPSGRVVQTQEPTYGDEVHAIAVGLGNPEEFVYAKVATVAPGLTREEVAGLSRKDGHALMAEVNRIFEGRPADQQAPFGSGSPPASPLAAESPTSTPSPA